MKDDSWNARRSSEALTGANAQRDVSDLTWQALDLEASLQSYDQRDRRSLGLWSLRLKRDKVSNDIDPVSGIVNIGDISV